MLHGIVVLNSYLDLPSLFEILVARLIACNGIRKFSIFESLMESLTFNDLLGLLLRLGSVRLQA